MAGGLEELILSYQSRTIDGDCFKKIAVTVKQASVIELKSFFESFVPKEIHLQLLRLYAARISGQFDVILKEVNGDSKILSSSCLDNPQFNRKLFQSCSQVLDSEFLIPFLQTLSFRNRKKFIRNLGKYMPQQCIAEADTLFRGIVGIWGISSALPLLCKCSEELIKQELPLIKVLPSFHLMKLARRFPYLVLEYLESHSISTVKTVKSIVRLTLPKSLDYCLKTGGSISKSTMKVIVTKYSNVILDSPTKWGRVLDADIVYKKLKPELLEQFLLKQFMEIESLSMPHHMELYFHLMTPTKVSAIMQKLLQTKYGCTIDSNLDFWKENEGILKLLNGSDRNCIALQLYSQSKKGDWVTLLVCEKSIDIIKNDLRFEADGTVRASLITKMLETVKINDDLKALEDVCQFVTERYCNDKFVMKAFFDSLPDLSNISEKIWTALLALAHKFYDPKDWMTTSAGNLFVEAVKRYPEKYINLFIEKYLSCSWCHNQDLRVLENLPQELRALTINLAFTQKNIAEEEYSMQAGLLRLLPVISKWNEKTLTPTVYPNVNKFVKTVLSAVYPDHTALEFVKNRKNGLDSHFVESCLEKASFLEYLRICIRKRLAFVNMKEVADTLIKNISERGLFRFVKVIEKMKKIGYTEFLNYLAERSKIAVNNITETNARDHAVFLLSLTANDLADYFSIIDPLLPTEESDKASVPSDEIQPDQLKQRKVCDIIHREIGISFSHFDLPTLAVDRLVKFCINGNLMLFVRDSLCSVCFSLRNDAAQKLILSLMDTPVSVQKHALRLHQKVCTIQCRMELLMSLVQKNDHITMRTIAVQSAVDCLNETKTVATWHVTKDILSRIMPIDKSIVVWLVSASVPNNYAEEYYQIILEKAKLLKESSSSVIASIFQVLCQKNASLSAGFLENLIKEYFLSDIFEDVNDHNHIFELFIIYLKGRHISKVPLEVSNRRQFLSEILKTHANEVYINNFDFKSFEYSGRMLVMDFVHCFCNACLHQVIDNNVNEINLSTYIDCFLKYLSQFDKSTFFQSVVNLTFTEMGKNAPEAIGVQVGKFCDDCLQNQPFLAHYALPLIVRTYFTRFYHSYFNTRQLIMLLTGMFPSSMNNEQERILRLVIIARVLPSSWISSKEFEGFKRIFLPLIKNTPAELLLLND